MLNVNKHMIGYENVSLHCYA